MGLECRATAWPLGELDLYGSVFGCESCSDLVVVLGVATFAVRGPMRVPCLRRGYE
jgi:hypothetical protein